MRNLSDLVSRLESKLPDPPKEKGRFTHRKGGGDGTVMEVGWVLKTCSQKVKGRDDWDKRVRPFSTIIRLWCSATPFCSWVYGHEMR